MTRASLTLDEILDLCALKGIRSQLPFSQLEAEAVWRGVDIAIVIRVYLLSLLRQLGVL